MLPINNKHNNTQDRFGLAGALCLGGALLAADCYKHRLFYWADKVKNLRLYSGILAPVNALAMVSLARQFASGDRETKIDAALGFLGQASSFSYNLPTFLTALKDLKVIPRRVAAFGHNLMILSVPLQLGQLALDLRQLKQNQKPLDLENRADLKRRLQINHLPQNANEDALKDRLWSVRLSTRLHFVADATMLVASLILLSHPAAHLVYFLYLQWAAFETIAGAVDFRSRRKLAAALHLPEENPLLIKITSFVGTIFETINRKADQLRDYLRPSNDFGRRAQRIGGFNYLKN